MGTYTAASASVDGIEVVTLRDADGATLSIAPKLGNLAFEYICNGKNALWFPYESIGAYVAEPDFCGIPFLAPWANRLDEHAFYAHGVRHELDRRLGNYLLDQDGQPIHGLLSSSPHWNVIDLRAGRDSASVVSRLDFGLHPDLMAQFPFSHRITIKYELKDRRLRVETVLENQSDLPMPVSVGFHPYFQLHDLPRDDWRLRLPAHRVWNLNARFTPTGNTSPISEVFPRHESLLLRDQFLDHVFGDLVPTDCGTSGFKVTGRDESITVRYGQAYPVAVVYAPTGENRSFVCFEPMTGITNAFNLAHRGLYDALPTVAPGQSWRGSFEVIARGF